MATTASQLTTLAAWRTQVLQLQEELWNIHTHKRLWRSIVDAVHAQADDTSRLWPNHYTQMYVVTQSIAVRRAIRGKRGDQVSLCGLLGHLEKSGQEVLTVANLMGYPMANLPGPAPKAVQKFKIEYLRETWMGGERHLRHHDPTA
jgi:hypothetical protein